MQQEHDLMGYILLFQSCIKGWEEKSFSLQLEKDKIKCMLQISNK